MTALQVMNEDQAFEFIAKLEDNYFDNKVVEISFDNWPVFEIRVAGDKYNSTLTSGMMKALIEFQSLLNRIYAEVVYQDSPKVLTRSEREALQIVYKIEKGSSNILIDASQFFTEMAKGAMEKMTGRQAATIILGAAALFAGHSFYDTKLKAEQKTLEEENRHEVTMGLLANNKELLSFANANNEAIHQVLRSVKDADKVVLDNKVEISKEELEVITVPERKTSSHTRLDGNYKVTGLKYYGDDLRIEVENMESGQTFSTLLSPGHLSINEVDDILKAFRTKSALKLNIYARSSANGVRSARILGVADAANGKKL